MNKLIVVAIAAASAVALLGADVADAKRLGGGRSFGMQRQGVAPAPATPAPSVTPPGAASNPGMPAPPGTAAARPATPAAAAAAPSGMSRWLGPIAGIAAGLGLAALLSHFGLSESFASFLLLALIVVGGIFLIRMFFARRPVTQATATARYGGVSPLGGASGRFEPANRIGAPDSLSAPGAAWGGGTPPSTTRRYPPGFEPAPFLEQAKLQFRRLQEANDQGDREVLANVMTPSLYREIVRDLDERRTHGPTEIVTLNADVVDVTQEGGRYVASIRFDGTLREDGAREATPVVEIWNLEKPANGSSGWLLSGIQQTEDTA